MSHRKAKREDGNVHINPRFQESCQLQIGHFGPGLVTFFLSFRDQLPYPAVALLVPGRAFYLGTG